MPWWCKFGSEFQSQRRKDLAKEDHETVKLTFRKERMKAKLIRKRMNEKLLRKQTKRSSLQEGVLQLAERVERIFSDRYIEFFKHPAPSPGLFPFSNFFDCYNYSPA